MGKTRKYRHRPGYFGNIISGDHDPKTVSVYRPVLLDERLAKVMPSIQQYVETFLQENNIWNSRKIALDGLRVTLLPTTKFSVIRSRSGVLQTPEQAQKRVFSTLPSRDVILEEITAVRGVVVTGNSQAAASLVFEDERLVSEQAAVYDAVGMQRESVRVPLMGLSVIPQLDYGVARRLNTGLSQVAPLVSVKLGPAYCDIRGPRQQDIS